MQAANTFNTGLCYAPVIIMLSKGFLNHGMQCFSYCYAKHAASWGRLYPNTRKICGQY